MEHIPFTYQEMSISGIVPRSWVEVEAGVWQRRASDTDPTHLIQQRATGFSCNDIIAMVMYQKGLEALPEHNGVIQSPSFLWDWYRGKASIPVPMVVDLALAQQESRVYIIRLGTTPDDMQNLHEAVFLPAVQALAPIALDPEYALQLGMNAEKFRQVTRENRKLLRNCPWPDFPVQSDQERGVPIPPPQKPYNLNAPLIDLPPPDRTILTKSNLFDCFADRKSHRKYTDACLTIQELAYLLWATQGVRQVTKGGKKSLRTVPAGGSIHPFETYLAINRVQGLKPGIYRYLPFGHKLVHLFAYERLAEKLSELSMGQAFVGQAAVCFIWSAVPYRKEWRYGLVSAKDILQEAGHVCQNLYLACESIGCGTCAIGAYNQEDLDRFLSLDDDDELVIYLAPVGKVNLA